MTHLLKEAFTKASLLSEQEQDTFATRMLAELAAEERWSDAFKNSQDTLAQLGREALAKHRTGKTQRLKADRQ